MTYLIIIAVAIISYLIGSINFSIILSKIISGKDIRESGSGNAGATNMLRTHGKKMGVITLLLDVLKGIIAILLSMLAINFLKGNAMHLATLNGGDGPTAVYLTTDYTFLKYIAGVCVILGHNFPLYFGFKGGKGVATSLGVVLMLDWQVGLIVAVFAIAIMAITRYVSLGSILGGAAYIIIKAIEFIGLFISMKCYNPDSWYKLMMNSILHLDEEAIEMICVIIIGGLLIARHHANIKRLLNGTENKLSFGKKEK